MTENTASVAREWRNPRYTSQGDIDLELKHEKFGWIPYTAADQSGEAEMQAIWDEAVAASPAPYVAPEPTGSDVNAERSRRIYLGKTFEVEGYGPVPLLGNPETITNLDTLALKAQTKILADKGDDITTYRDAVNVNHDLTQPMVIDLWEKATDYMEEVYGASWTLKDGETIPQDYSADKHWP